jgi:hypothetical protein
MMRYQSTENDAQLPPSTTKVNYKVWTKFDDLVHDFEKDEIKAIVRKWECEDSITFVVTSHMNKTIQYEVCCSFVPYAVANNIVESFPWLKLKKHKHLFFVEGIVQDLNALIELYQRTSTSPKDGVVDV